MLVRTPTFHSKDKTLIYILHQAGGNLQLYPEEEQHYVSNLPAISDTILWRAGSAGCEMWDGHCHGF
ncbi:hypothetical protein TIFTF001_052710 [Ficus carica]|uniref:Uncharacterized protein n=1 Tax=Ficus carica TaxID=3494 RepID=A0AA88EC71_FICCA|nr:hypothetical protein TIFTF001_052710 [Ficus carica]